MKRFWVCPKGRAILCNLFAQRQQKGFPLLSLTLIPQVVLLNAMFIKMICYYKPKFKNDMLLHRYGVVPVNEEMSKLVEAGLK